MWKKRVTDFQSIKKFASSLLFPTKCVHTQELPCKLPRILSNRWTSWGAQGRTLLIRTPRGRTFCILTIVFGPEYPELWEHKTAPLKLASVMTMSCLPRMGGFNAFSQGTLTVFLVDSHVSLRSDVIWLAFLLWAICKTSWAFLYHFGIMLPVIVHKSHVAL